MLLLLVFIDGGLNYLQGGDHRIVLFESVFNSERLKQKGVTPTFSKLEPLSI